MPPLLPCLVTVLAFFTITEQTNNSLKELEQILKNLATQAAPNNQAKNYQQLPYYLRPQPQQERRNRNINNPTFKDGTQYENKRNLNSQQQLEYTDNDKTREYDDNRQDDKTQEYEDRRQRQDNSRLEDKTQEYEDRRPRLYDRRQKQEDKTHEYIYEDRRQRQGDNRLEDKTEEYENRRQRQGDRRQRHDNRRQKQDDRRQRRGDRRQRQDDRRQRRGDRRQQQSDNRHRQEDKTQEYEDRRQRQDDRIQEDDKTQESEDMRQRQLAREQEQDDRTQEYKDRRQRHYKTADFDIIILDVPELNEFQNRGEDIKKSDVRQHLQKRQNSYDTNEKKGQKINNLEDFIKYYEKIKKEIEHKLGKYVNGVGSKFLQMLPDQNELIAKLKNIQSQAPVTDNELEKKLVQVFFDTLNNIKFQLYSENGRDIHISERAHNVIPINNQNTISRSTKRLFPLTFFQKQRQRNLSPKNLILKHSWRRNDQQGSNYGVPFDLQVQGLGQIN